MRSMDPSSSTDTPRKRKHTGQVEVHRTRSLISSLPTDVMIEIMGCIASSSFSDLFTSKLCCKEFMAATENKYVLGRVSIPEDKFPVVRWHNADADDKAKWFLRRCLESGNPEALFREGMLDYFSRGKVERGLENLRSAVEKGHVDASYVYGIILLCTGGTSNTKLALKLLNHVNVSSQSSSSSTISSCRKRARSVIRQMWVNNRLKTHQQDDQEDAHTLHPHGQSEAATSAVSGWPRGDDEVVDVMGCEACAWAREAAKFCNIVQGHA